MSKKLSQLKGKLWKEFNETKYFYPCNGADYIVAMGETAKSIVGIEKLERESRRLKRAKKGQSLKALRKRLWQAVDRAQNPHFTRTARAQALGSITQAIIAVEKEQSVRRKIYRAKFKNRGL